MVDLATILAGFGDAFSAAQEVEYANGRTYLYLIDKIEQMGFK